MLSPTALRFKEFFIRYSIAEAASTTPSEEMNEVATAIRNELEATSFVDIVYMAIDEGLIDSSDDIYISHITK